VNEVLSSEITREIPALNWNVVKAEWQAVLNRQRPFDFRIWRWLNLVIWVKTYGIRFS
jgi:asparagine synthase (glutamine-hydrolysing)